MKGKGFIYLVNVTDVEIHLNTIDDMQPAAEVFIRYGEGKSRIYTFVSHEKGIEFYEQIVSALSEECVGLHYES